MYGKGGFWTDDDHGTHVEQSNAYFLPLGMELVVLCNSPFCQADRGFMNDVTRTAEENIVLNRAVFCDGRNRVRGGGLGRWRLLAGAPMNQRRRHRPVASFPPRRSWSSGLGTATTTGYPTPAALRMPDQLVSGPASQHSVSLTHRPNVDHRQQPCAAMLFNHPLLLVAGNPRGPWMRRADPLAIEHDMKVD
jgi:hypothetical protein